MKKERLYERLDTYKRASERLTEATKLQIDHAIVYDGVIQRFEFTFELSWKLMKAFLEYAGFEELKSPRATIREAYAYGLIHDGDEWIDMMTDRNKTSHIYDEGEARTIYIKIKMVYEELLRGLIDNIEQELRRVQ